MLAVNGARLGRFYYAAPDGGGIYYLSGSKADGYALVYLPRRVDGQIAWGQEEMTGEVDFFRIEPELREQAYEAGRVLCLRAGLDRAAMRRVLGISRVEE